MVLKLGDISIHSWQSYNVCMLFLLFFLINHWLDEKTHFLWTETDSVIKKELLEVQSVLEINKNRIWASHYGREEKQLYTGRGNLFYLTDLDYCYLRRL